jgi:hypothetical protein
VFIDPIADIAVFGTPDTRDRGKEAEAYEELTGEVAFKIGKLKALRLRTRAASMTVNGKQRVVRVRTMPPGFAASEARICRSMASGSPAES